MFNPAHDAVVLFAVETATVTESANGTTPAAWSAAASNAPTVLGYTNLPQTRRGENNSKGKAIGQQVASYNKRGGRTPGGSIEIRPGSVDALANFFPTNGVLPSLTLYVAVKGQYTDIYRGCKISTATLNFSPSGTDGGEITISVDFEAISYERGAARTVSTADLRALGTPLFWHDVRQFDIEDSAGTIVGYRKQLMSVSAKIDYSLERKNQRPNWGDQYELSRTSYALLEHTVDASGEMGFHDRLPESLFTTAATSQDWGDIVLHCSDAAVGASNSKGFLLTFQNCMPTDESMQSGDANAEIDHTVPFVCDTIIFAVDEE